MRIATLLPSATEIVCALGLGEHLVGVSHSCEYPPEVERLPRLTSTHVPYREDSQAIDTYVREHLESNAALYDLDLDAMAEARPDFVVSQALCDVCAVATGEVDEAVCALPGSPTLIDLTPNTLDDVFADISRVAEVLGVGATGDRLVSELRARRDRVAERTASIAAAERPRVAFLEWLIPPFNGGHWNPELVTTAGGDELLGMHAKPSFTLDWPHVVEQEPEVLFIACCGLTIERAMEDVEIVQTSDAWNRLPAVRTGRVYVADGNAYFASPGPRLIDGLEIMAHALHPGVHPRQTHHECLTVGGQI